MSNPNLIFDLSKAATNKGKLVPKQVQVTRGGKTFTQTVWVNPNQNNPTQNGSKAFDFSEFENLKSDRGEAMKYLKDCGITWQEHSHDGVNWMRASMAAKQAAGISAPSGSSSSSSVKSSGTKAVPKLDYKKLAGDGYDNLDGKKKVVAIKKQIDKDGFVSIASKVTNWTPHSNPAINLMRASMEFSKWCETHSMDELSIALGGQATGLQSAQVKKQPDKPVDTPKPKDELEIKPTHTERQKNLIKIINAISDENDLKNYTSTGMVPEDDTAKSFIVDKLLKEYDTHIRPRVSGTGGYRRGYHTVTELEKTFSKMTTKLYRGVAEKIVKKSVGQIVNSEMLYDFVDPRNGVTIHREMRRGYSSNMSLYHMIEQLNHQNSVYAEDVTDGITSNSHLESWDVEELPKSFSEDKDGFIRAVKHVVDVDPSLKSQAEETIKTYVELMECCSHTPKLLHIVTSRTWEDFETHKEKTVTKEYQVKALVEELRKHGLNDKDIKATTQKNYYGSNVRANHYPLYRHDDNSLGWYSTVPVLDANGEQICVDLTQYIRDDTGEVLWSDPDTRLDIFNPTQTEDFLKTGKYEPSVNALQTITEDKYNKIVELSCKLYGVKIQDKNSKSDVTTKPSTWGSYYGDFTTVKDGDNEELDAILTNLSFIMNTHKINFGIANRMYESMNSKANKDGEDYSGNFNYHVAGYGAEYTRGTNPQKLTAKRKNEIISQQLKQTRVFTKHELTTLRDYVNSNGDPTTRLGWNVDASETLSRITSLSPQQQGFDGIRGTPINDIYTAYIENSVQYCPQVYNTRIKDREGVTKWIHKTLDFTPYTPTQATTSSPSVSGTKLYELRKTLFNKAHCSIRTATSQEYADITHKVKMDFDYVDPKTGKRVPKSERAYDNRTLALHGNVYIINNSSAQEEFQKEAARLNETPIQMYHGTSYGGGCGIIGVDGKFRISGKETYGLQTSGSMLGQGIYMAKLVGKTLPYLGNDKYSYSSYNVANYSGPTQGHRSDGCLLVCDTVLGRHYHSNTSTADAARHNDGTYDSVAVGAGAQMGIGGTLKEYECIVRRNNQVLPKYIVDCGGRVR